MKKIKDPALFKTIKSFLTIYLTTIKKRSPHTIQAYKDTLNIFIAFMKNNKNVEMHALKSEHFNQDNILRFLEWLMLERGNSDTTRNQRLMCIRVFCKYMAGENMLAYESLSQIQKIGKIPVPDKFLDTSLSIDDVRMILEVPNTAKSTGLRDQFYIALLYDSGCRNQEILDLRLKDIMVEGEVGSVNIVGKGRKFRVTPLSKEVIAMYKRYTKVFHSNRSNNEFLFYTTRKGITTQMSADNVARFLNTYEEIAREASPDIPHLHPHLFRHVRALHLYQAGMPLPIIGQWLGHSQLETTLIYAYADTEMKKASVDKVINANNSVFTNDVFTYQDDDEVIRRLYGLA